MKHRNPDRWVVVILTLQWNVGDMRLAKYQGWPDFYCYPTDEKGKYAEWEIGTLADARFVPNHFASQACGAEFAPEVGEVDAEIVGLIGGFGSPDCVEKVGVGKHPSDQLDLKQVGRTEKKCRAQDRSDIDREHHGIAPLDAGRRISLSAPWRSRLKMRHPASFRSVAPSS